MADRQDEDEKSIVSDLINDAVIADSNPKEAVHPAQLFRSIRPGL